MLGIKQIKSETMPNVSWGLRPYQIDSSFSVTSMSENLPAYPTKKTTSCAEKNTLIQVQPCNDNILFFPLAKSLKTYQVLILYRFYFHARHPKPTLPRTLNEGTFWYGLNSYPADCDYNPFLQTA